MKRVTTAICLFVSVTFAAAQDVAPSFQTTDDGCLQIVVGQLSMTIDAGHGGKILSFKRGGQEIISQSRFPEAFGSTFWTSPQKEWNWPPVPEYDKQPYAVERQADRFVLTSQVSPRLRFRIRKEFSVDAANETVVIAYTIVNEDSVERRVAPWEITRVANDGGTIFFDAPSESVTPVGLMTFEQAHGALWYTADEAPQNRKINADGHGWLAYASGGLLLVKHFDDLQPAQPAPGEAEVQVYVNRGKTYIELESQGAYTTLAPGRQLTWTVRWRLLPIDSSAPSGQLVSLAARK